LDAELAGEVGGSEEQVAKLFLHLGLLADFGCHGNLVELLAYLGEGLAPVGPVELDRGGTAAQLLGPGEGREDVGNVIEQRGRGGLLAGGLLRPLLGLDLVPFRLGAAGVPRRFLTEYMRMPPYQLFCDGINDVADIEQTSLG